MNSEGVHLAEHVGADLRFVCEHIILLNTDNIFLSNDQK